MVKTTKAQRAALFRVFLRDFPGWLTPTKRLTHPQLYRNSLLPKSIEEAEAFAVNFPHLVTKVPSKQYRRFRRTVTPYVGGECVMVPYAGMWLGIETDGYTHS